MHEARVFVRLRVRLGPPVAQVALLVELAALIVEAVRQFVADHGAGAAVVDGGVAAGLIERRLQNAGGEVDGVAIGAVVRVDRRRRHAPLAAIDRLADLVERPLALERRRPLPVAERVVPHDAHGGVIAPLVRIADAIDDGVQLGMGGALRFRAHPRRLVDVLASSPP